MAVYVIQARGMNGASLARARTVRDGFSWGAFVFAQLWLLAHRLWLALLVWVALEAAFLFLVFPNVSGLTAALVDLLAHLYIGFEGNRLRVAKSARLRPVVAVVTGRNRDEAEARFFTEVQGEQSR